MIEDITDKMVMRAEAVRNNRMLSVTDRMAMTYSLTTFDSNTIDTESIKGFIYNLGRLLGTDVDSLKKFKELF